MPTVSVRRTCKSLPIATTQRPGPIHGQGEENSVGGGAIEVLALYFVLVLPSCARGPIYPNLAFDVESIWRMILVRISAFSARSTLQACLFYIVIETLDHV